MAVSVGDTFVDVSRFEALLLDRLPRYVYVYTDPTTITVTVTSPAGIVSTYTLAGATVTKVVSETGLYYCQVPCTETGKWKAKWVSTGAAAGSETHEWMVDP